ncbi:MAG: bifunctional glutamate N-acetyltransferase/amino-acid acetyltransferase ArgJ, partial [Oceanococcus sp.]
MAVNLAPAQNLLPVAGVELASCAAGIRYQGRDDLVLVRLAEGSQVAAVFTRNAFCAAPVTICRQHLAAGQAIRGVLINAGNANAGTGQAGFLAAQKTCVLAAEQLDIDADAVLPLSTGVIGQTLSVSPFQAALPNLVPELSEQGWTRAASAIMTTDTVAKGASRQIEIAGQPISVTGIAKGAGMIRPDMATMLSFVATDAAVAPEKLQALLNRVVNTSFNAITVDGDTSTNDALVLAATGASGCVVSSAEELLLLETAVREVCEQLAQACVRDAEGATRFVTVDVCAARDENEARQ